MLSPFYRWETELSSDQVIFQGGGSSSVVMPRGVRDLPPPLRGAVSGARVVSFWGGGCTLQGLSTLWIHYLPRFVAVATSSSRFTEMETKFHSPSGTHLTHRHIPSWRQDLGAFVSGVVISWSLSFLEPITQMNCSLFYFLPRNVME